MASPENLHYMHELWEQDKKLSDPKTRSYRSDPSGKQRLEQPHTKSPLLP